MASNTMPDSTRPTVLITRPQGQQIPFAEQCRAAGFDVSLLPCMDILPMAVDREQLSKNLDAHQTVLFTSANAVRFAHEILPLPWPEFATHAIGAATAHALQQRGQTLVMTPAAPYTSEAYLEQLSHLRPSSLLLIKGLGGRDLIKLTLRQCGWQVQSVDVYQRAIPVVSERTIERIFEQQAPDIISVTSNEVLENLWQLAEPYHGTLKQTALVCNSQRCARLAASLGFSAPALVAQPAGDEGQLACLRQWMSSV